MSSGLPGAFPSEDVVVKKTETTTLREPATTGSPYEPATTAITTKTTTTTEAPLSTHTAALVDPAAESTTDGPDFAEEAKRLAGEAMTAAAAIGLAAKDAVLAAKDAAMPVVTDAAVAARDVAVPAVTDAAVATRDAAVPAANVASEKAANAAEYAKESAANIADTARANAPIIPGIGDISPTSHNAHSGSIDETATGIPTEVRDSIVKSGRGPEAAGDWQAVQDKSRMENELLHSVHKTEDGTGNGSRSQHQGIPELGAISGITNEAHRPVPYTQDTGSYRTPGTAVVLGTGTERAFPLGATHDEAKHSSTSTSVPDFSDTPLVTTGLETRPTREVSEATGRGDYAHETGSRNHGEELGSGYGGAGRGEFAQESGARSHTGGVGSGYGSIEGRNSSSSHGGPALADLPVREIHAPTSGAQAEGRVPTSQHEVADRQPGRESTDSTGSVAYKTLSSGTPSGVRL